MVNIKDLPKDFDWEVYLELNHDLKKTGITNKLSAEIHYLNHGRKENRLFLKKTSNWDEFIKICVDLNSFLPKKYPNINKNSDKKSILVETRNLPHNEFVIKNTIQKLGDGWGHIIFCHERNYEQIKTICCDISDLIEINLLENELDRNDYNNLFLDFNFWKKINCKKILIYQTDTFIVKKIDDCFLDYDYVAGLWPKSHTNFLKENNVDIEIGNGGLCIRDVDMVKEALLSDLNDAVKNNNFVDKTLSKMTEDTFYSFFFKNKKIPPTSKCLDFSCECSINHFNENSFGYHKPWNSFITSEELNKKLKKLFFNNGN